jgi:microcystin degradation protein MlrC
MKRVGIIGLLHESNTFIQQPTSIEHFRSNVLATSQAALDAFRGSQHEIGGFIASLDNEVGIEAVGVFAARATPYGAISGRCWSVLMEMLESELKRHLPVDGLLVAPHGATVAESARDADGDWLARVRAIVGNGVPIIGTLDLHANVSVKMVESCDALFGYRSNPHLDQFARGKEAGRTMIRTLNNQIQPCQRLVQLPMCINIERQATDEPQGKQLWQRADELAKANPGIISVSCLYGFPYSDVHEMGASVVVVAENAKAPLAQVSKTMADEWWRMRSAFLGQLTSLEESISLSRLIRQSAPNRPVGLLDMGDNVGGGSPGDGTTILHSWIAPPSKGPVLAVLCDPEVAKIAKEAGVGAMIDVAVGGKQAPELHGPPIMDRFRVRSLTEGKFNESGATHGGYNHFDQGPTAVIEGQGGATLVVTTLRVAPLSLQQVLSQGLDLNDFAAIVIKGVHAPAAVYAAACSRLIRVNTTGVTTADLAQLTFKHRRSPLYPFEGASE